MQCALKLPISGSDSPLRHMRFLLWREYLGSWFTSFCAYLGISSQERIQLKDLHKQKVFLTGLVIKLFLSIFFISEIQQIWFVPFLTAAIQGPFFDPWTSFLDGGGIIYAFPYGHAMYYAYLPLTIIGNTLFGEIGSIIGFRLSSLLFDYLLLLSVAILTVRYSQSRLLVAYWLNPITIYILYIHGQIDILPVLLLTIGIILMHKAKPWMAGLFFAIAMSAKLSMFVALPFVLIYLQRNQRLVALKKDLLMSLTIFTGSMILLTSLSHGARSMIVQNPESVHLLDIKIRFGPDLYLYLIPCVYVVCLYLIWRLETISFDLFVVSVGLGFFSLLILLPPSPGWTLWIIPFLVFYQVRAGKGALLTSMPFVALFIAYYVAKSEYSFYGGLDLCSVAGLSTILQQQGCSEYVTSILFTFMQISAALVCIRMYVYGIARHPFYLRRKRPFTLITASRSGAKVREMDGLLRSIIGANCISSISTSEYLKKSNLLFSNTSSELVEPTFYNLNMLVDDVNTFFKAKSHELDANSFTKQTYSKYSGVASKRKDFLHIYDSSLFAMRILKRYCSLSIFIEGDNSLPSDVACMHSKDSSNDENPFDHYKPRSGQSELLEACKEYDVSLGIRGVTNRDYQDGSSADWTKTKSSLFVLMANGLFHSDLTKLLIAMCAANIDTEYVDGHEKVLLRIEADLCRDDIKQLALVLIPDLHDVVPFNAYWYDGYQGLMQLVVLLLAIETMKRETYA